MLGRVPSIDEFEGMVLAAFSFDWRRKCRPGTLTESELLLARMSSKRKHHVGISEISEPDDLQIRTSPKMGASPGEHGMVKVQRQRFPGLPMEAQIDTLSLDLGSMTRVANASKSIPAAGGNLFYRPNVEAFGAIAVPKWVDRRGHRVSAGRPSRYSPASRSNIFGRS